ncbi:hypothetical protein Sru01_05680 [Sphaerisporangium rufum]|uniref:Uncharacterized protein n=1 Tax=Sphaerisporangium rufum TaxID=1381558 RepID=A0A919QZE6_9ACTN|nr:hypothetical protein Sru01_05680 [Sphaerisporangium rufum]
MGEHPGLARTGAGDDEQRAARVHDGLALLRVEPVEQRMINGGVHGSGRHAFRLGPPTDNADPPAGTGDAPGAATAGTCGIMAGNIMTPRCVRHVMPLGGRP